MTFRRLRSLVMLGASDSNLLWHLLWPVRLLLPLRADLRWTGYDKNHWEAEFAGGRWACLYSLEEAGHYYIIALYVKMFGGNGAILDVGCGEGILQSIVKPFGDAKYLGIDLSENAIQVASKKSNLHTSFLAVKAQEFMTEERFNTIIFNETLYYFPQPAKILEYYAQFLSRNGVFIISMTLYGIGSGLLTLGIWRDIERYHVVLKEMVVHTKSGATWIVKVLKPNSYRAPTPLNPIAAM